MRILFIAGQSIKSNSSVTMMNLAYIQGLVELGHELHILTSKLPENHISIDDGLVIPEGVKIYEFPLSTVFNHLSNKKKGVNSKKKYSSFIKDVLRRIYYKFSIYDSQKSWIKNARKVTFENDYFDLIISSSDPKHTHLFAMEIINLHKVRFGKWIQIWGDPLFLDITRKRNYMNKRLLKEEKRVMSAADKVFYVSPFTAQKQKELFPTLANKIDYILIPFLIRDETEPRAIEMSDMVFGYFGDYNSDVRNLEHLYTAALDLNLNLIVRGNSNKPVPSTSNIDSSSRVSIKELEEIERNTDVYIHLCNSRGTQIPAKVYYYSGTLKPILFILDGEVNPIYEFFSKYERYYFCENKKEKIIQAMNEIRSRNNIKIKSRVIEEMSPISIATELLLKTERNDDGDY
ncbi:hypothetical protein BSK52_20340 [Paenibacillus odorifer]|uniref:Glycosyltransferase subfamily 4-like N-terminal domain-containing protein n=2 Tax=Paenibacillus odorifer TaxID=189426 RepID=A0A1R0XSR9_9BACL|nr:hypothetical protein BSK52_20340 [Paenibacillus odorifer]